MYKDCSAAQDARKRSSTIGVTTPSVHCQHIQSVQEEITSEADGTFPAIHLHTNILPELPFPSSIKTDLLKLKVRPLPLRECPVSHSQFVTKVAAKNTHLGCCMCTSENPTQASIALHSCVGFAMLGFSITPAMHSRDSQAN